jgi:ribose transport system substrate-binding protein
MLLDMPRIRPAVLLACVVLAAAGLPACGDDAESTGSAAGGGQDLAGKRIAYVAFNSTTYNAIGCAAKQRAEDLGAEFDQSNAKEFTAQSQTPVLNAALAGSPDALISSPTDPKGLLGPITAASAKMPVATVMNTLEDRDPVTTEVVFDSVSAGRMAADYLADRAGGKAVKIVGLSFTPGGSKAADDEVKGFEEAIGAHDNVEYLGTEYIGAQDQIGAATKKISAVLSAHPDLFAVFAHAGATGTGALAAIRQREADTLIVANYSATNPDIVKAMRAGEVAAIADFPYEKAGVAAVEQLANELTGQPAKATVPFPAVLYTKASFDDPEQAENLKTRTC